MSWRKAIANAHFKWMLIVGCILIIINLFIFPHYFAFIQQRKGTLLNDIVLANIPSADVSILIFTVIYFSVIISVRRAIIFPQLFLTFLWAYLLLNVARITSIYLIPLEPPIGLVTLTDPTMVPFYGKTTITKDLFFSGHTATVFLTLLIVQKKWEKILMSIAFVVVVILLLIQHIHYTIDVLAAPFFTYFIYIFARRVSATSISQHTPNHV